MKDYGILIVVLVKFLLVLSEEGFEPLVQGTISDGETFADKRLEFLCFTKKCVLGVYPVHGLAHMT